MNNVLIARNLYKTYGKSSVINNLNISIKKGEIYGLVGKNGAGKTTLMRMILSLVTQTSGEIELFNSSVEKERIKQHHRIGAIIEGPAFYPYLSAKDNLEYYRIQKGLNDKNAVDEVLSIVGLGDVGQKKYSKFSLGMKQRLALALAIISNPDFLVLDEPTNGLDPEGIRDIRDILLKLNKTKGTTILISSHILGELSQLATNYGFIDKGHIIEEISSKALEKKCSNFLLVKVDNVAKAKLILQNDLSCKIYEVLDGNIIKIYDFLDKPDFVGNAFFSGGVAISSFEKSGINLEEYFLELIGGNKNGKSNIC